MDKNTRINEMEITDEYQLASASDTVLKVSRKLQELSKETAHGAVLIAKDKNKVIGFITNDEIVDLIAQGKDPMAMDAKMVMNKDFDLFLLFLSFSVTFDLFQVIIGQNTFDRDYK